jgi:ribonuclease HII
MSGLKARFSEDLLIEIGIDEAGRGSFWGPIMAGAVILPSESEWTETQKSLLIQLRDSKKISPKKREKLYEEIKLLIPSHSIGIVTSQEINQNGIQWANKEAFRRAYLSIPSYLPNNDSNYRLLIDGILSIDDCKIEQQLIVEGDNQYIAIAAASILAKVEHDHWIQQYCKEHPECNERYDLIGSKGYGTTRHREGIKQYGGHELHRMVYIQNWLPGSTKKPKLKKKQISENQCMIQFNGI